MSTTVRDFSSARSPVARSPIARSPEDNRVNRDRRGSARSNLSVRSSNDFGMLHRRPSRTNTVLTYEEPEHPNWHPGAEQGIDTAAEDEELPAHLANLKANCDIKIIDFSEEEVVPISATNSNIAEILEKPRPEDLPCRWISVNGLSWDVIRALGNKFDLHQLAIEDLIHTHTRTKVDWYSDQAFIVLTLQKLVRLHQHKGSNQNCDCLHTEDEVMNEKRDGNSSGWWWQSKGHKDGVLPYYLDRDNDGKIDEFVPAHSGVDEASPIKQIRTLHRYESAQSPEHTAWMEQHSVLAKENLAVSVEQVAIFLLADNCVISFFEQSADDVEKPIAHRLQSRQTILRKSVDASLLTQAIIDAIVDLSVPVRDAYNKARKDLQIDAMTNPNIRTSRALHIFGEEIDMLQNLFKPIVQLVNALRDHHSSEPLPDMISVPPGSEGPKPPPSPRVTDRGSQGTPKLVRNQSDYRRVALLRKETASVSFSPLAHTYFGDVLDHCITMISALEQMDASAGNISTLIFNTVGAKTNNFMMILAVVTVFFAPLTFISGYFGMNFASGNGLDHPFGFFWIVAIPSLVAFMLLVFATMLWDNISDALNRRGINRAHWHRRHLKISRTGTWK